MNKTIGFGLIILGTIMLIWSGFTYSQKEKVVDAGPIHISADRQKTVTWPPFLGGILLIAGIAVVVFPGKRN